MEFSAQQVIDLLQWPAMVSTLGATWLVASRRPLRRHAGFWIFLLSNALWLLWGWHAGAWGLIVLQLGLAVLNFRGLRKTDPPAGTPAA